MRKNILLYIGIISLSFINNALAQLPANPWDTADFDAAVSASSAAGVAHITRSDDDTAYIPSIKYQAINADSAAPVYTPAIDSDGNAKTGVMVNQVETLSTTTAQNVTPASDKQTIKRQPKADSWRGSGRFGQLNYTGEVTTYGTAYGQEMLAPEVNNHNMNVMLQHLRDLGYKIPDSYDNKFQTFTQDYANDLRNAYNGLGHQNNPFDTMFSGFLDIVEDQSGLDMENLLFNSIDLMSRD